MSVVLIIDDNVQLCQMLSTAIGRLGHRVTAAHSIREGLERASVELPEIVFLDVMLPDGNGLEALQLLRRLNTHPEVILMTGQGDVDSAELATRRGAWCYIVKGVSVTPYMNALSNALDYRSEHIQCLRPIVPEDEGIVGESHQLQICLNTATQAACSDVTVLISGDTGTGKEVFARAIHNNSARRAGNFVVVDCAALPETLVESILFGHTKGAFTGADKVREGLVKQADGGTLFLDEVGELPLSLQPPFLRVLQEQRFRPVGSDEEAFSDFRLIAATNRDLDAMVRQNLFRQDLLYRIRGFELHLPSLRERENDVELIAMHHAEKVCGRYDLSPKRFSSDFLEMLKLYHWPGNVRELTHAVERAIVGAQHQETVFARHLPEKIRIAAARQVTAEQLANDDEPNKAPPNQLSFKSLKDIRDAAAEEAEKQYLHRLMQMASGDVNHACSVAGLSRSRLYALLKRHQLTTRC